jgi:hypothetical protein
LKASDFLLVLSVATFGIALLSNFAYWPLTCPPQGGLCGYALDFSAWIPTFLGLTIVAIYFALLAVFAKLSSR